MCGGMCIFWCLKKVKKKKPIINFLQKIKFPSNSSKSKKFSADES